MRRRELVDFEGTDVPYGDQDYKSYLLPNGAEASLIALGINKTNISEFRYHVVEDDSVEIVPWSPIPGLQQQYRVRQTCGFLGTYRLCMVDDLLNLNSQDWAKYQGGYS